MGFEASTLAVSVAVYDNSYNLTQAFTNTLARVRFQITSFDQNEFITNKIDAVYCEDLFAEKIAAE